MSEILNDAMNVSLDFGGSTLDIALWEGRQLVGVEKKEVPGASWEEFEKFLSKQQWSWSEIDEIFVSGGKSSTFPSEVNGVVLTKVNEIEAIGHGGNYLLGTDFHQPCLVVSMGTGTCMVKIEQQESELVCEHIGGTGVGGGTFLGLAKELLGETDVEKLKGMFQLGDKAKVDLSVKDIVGGGIGIVSGDATASNLGKLMREIDFSKSDLASGMVNLIGQTIAITAVFGAKAYGCDVVVLTGKLTQIEKILEVVLQVGEFYGMKMVVPKNAAYVSAIGAFIAGNSC